MEPIVALRQFCPQCQIPIFPAGETSFVFASHCAAILFSQVPKKCADLDLRLLYIWILGTYSKFARKNNFLALGVWLPADMLAGLPGRNHVYFTSINQPTNCFVSITMNWMKCLVNWIPLRMRVCWEIPNREARGNVVIWWKTCWHNFWRGQLREILLAKIAPFKKFRSSKEEEARTGWRHVDGGHHKASQKLYFWIKLIWNNTMHCAKFGAQQSKQQSIVHFHY